MRQALLTIVVLLALAVGYVLAGIAGRQHSFFLLAVALACTGLGLLGARQL